MSSSATKAMKAAADNVPGPTCNTRGEYKEPDQVDTLPNYKINGLHRLSGLKKTRTKIIKTKIIIVVFNKSYYI